MVLKIKTSRPCVTWHGHGEYTADDSDSQLDCGHLCFFLSILYFTTLLNGSIQTGLVQLVAFRRQNKCSNINKEATPFQITIWVTGRGGGFVCFVLFQVTFTTSLPRQCSFFLLFLLSFPHPPVSYPQKVRALLSPITKN